MSAVNTSSSAAADAALKITQNTGIEAAALAGGAPSNTCVTRDTSEKYVGVDGRAEYFVNVCPDPTVMNSTRSAPIQNNSGLPISVSSADDARGSVKVVNEFSDRKPDDIDAQMQYIAANLLPRDYFAASLEHNRIGQGYVSTYKSDKPPQGIQIIREEIRVPGLESATLNTSSVPLFNSAYVGPYNMVHTDGLIPNTDMIADPRYSAPTVMPSQGIRVPIDGSSSASYGTYGAPSIPVAAQKLTR